MTTKTTQQSIREIHLITKADIALHFGINKTQHLPTFIITPDILKEIGYTLADWKRHRGRFNKSTSDKIKQALKIN